MSLRIRHATPDDAAALRSLVIDLQNAEAQFNPWIRDGESMADGYVRQLLEGDPDEPGELIVAEIDGGEVVGYITIQPHVPQHEAHEVAYDFAYVSDVVVAEGHRGQGVGAALLAAAERYARQQGATLMRLGVLADNVAARSLYLRMGYQEHEVLLQKNLAEGES